MNAVTFEALKGLECGTQNDTSTGKVWFEGCRLAGQFHGLCHFYYESGAIQSEKEYDEGKQDGLEIEYYSEPAGSKQAVRDWVDGQLVREVGYHWSGERQYTMDQYKDGEPHGTMRSFYPSGRLSSMTEYQGGQRVHKIDYCDDDARTECGERWYDGEGSEKEGGRYECTRCP